MSEKSDVSNLHSIHQLAEAAMSASAAPSSTGQVLLEVCGLTKDFPGMRALDNVNLEVKAGEIHALLGENGAGKSTLIKAIAGAHTPTEGEIRVDGQTVQMNSPQDAQALGIGVLHQHGNLVPTLSVQENLMLGEPLPRRAGFFVDWAAVERHGRQSLDRVGLHNVEPRAMVSDLRPDQVAMVSIAKAVARDAKVIILDEPTSALLPHEVEILFGQMRKLAAEGHGFIYVSHRLAEVFDIADRVTVLRDGLMVGSWGKAEIDRRKIVEAIVGAGKEFNETGATSERMADGEELLKIDGLVGLRVKGASFTVHEGEILGIAGLPGNGAEETINLLFGRGNIASGEVYCSGKPLNLNTPRDAIRAGIALVPKNRLTESMLPGFSVRENISLPNLMNLLHDPILRLIHRKNERKLANGAVADLNIRTTGIEASIDSLSGGNQQKAILGRWFARDAKVYILNSPTAAVDVGAKAEIYGLIRKLASNGAGILFASTEVEEFPRICHRVIVFHKGHIVGELVGNEIKEADIMHLAVGETKEGSQ